MALSLRQVYSVIFVGIVGLTILPAVNAAAFHVWVDSQGIKHVSTVPRSGFNADGKIRRAYDPRTMAFQRAQMEKRLSAEGAELARLAQQVTHNEPADLRSGEPKQARPPKEGFMGLRDLIDLGRRGGRYSPR